jgi:cell division transport system ATP-binding protein
MDRSVADNLKFVMKATGWTGKKKINQKIEELLSKVEMTDKADAFPHLISGGEQQRAAVARALINDPELIIADEPTGNLDPETSGKIMLLLKSVVGDQKTLIMATHDFEVINKFPGRIVKFDNKSIVE